MPGARSHLVDYIYDFHVLCLIRNAPSARERTVRTRDGCIGRCSASDAALGPSANDKLIRAGELICD